GQYWRLSVRLKRPYGFMNPAGFDYEGWLFQHRIRTLGYVLNTPDNTYLGKTRGRYISRSRYFLREKINNELDKNPYSGLIVALSLGDSSQIPKIQYKVLVNTGTNHLLAISGLHISLIAGLFYFLARKLWSIGGVFTLYLAAPRFAAIAAMAAATIYAILAGFSIPTQRSLIMLAVVMWALFNYRQYAFSHIISTALLLVLIADPFAAIAPGFWLSFGAIAVIAYGMSCRVSTDSIWWRWGRAQYLVSIGLLPVLLLWFQQYPILGILANLVAVPWVSLLVVPLALAGTVLINLSVSLGGFCLELGSEALGLLWPFLELVTHSDITLWHQSSPPLWALLASFAGVIILLQPQGLPARWTGLVWILPLLFPHKEGPANNELWFTLLDVGQGLSAVVQTRDHTLVYDTGAKFSTHFNAGSAVLIPYLRKAGVNHIDTLLISHGDNDHIGGAADLLSAFPDTPVLTSVPNMLNHPRMKQCHDGQAWKWDGIEFQVLHPDGKDNYSDNNRSCVLKVSTGLYSILLSGDIEKETEYRLVKEYNSRLSVTVLIAPHHGSKTSSTPEFIDTIAPELVLFPVGYRNRYKFPNMDIIARYESRGIHMLDTARHGAILIKMNTSGMSVTQYRQLARRFWHTQF
ncbi:MAG: DNA internalization-related competence protein ComEC/Rec2, partial [Gammaproteobacteria bacterium]|nr:DNA internalization-related competence protein ComEC/Rec2 [Gammaproteobacteria bacterium]